jgi:uncharacterized membrane protein
VLGLYYLFRGFQEADASDVVPVVSSVNAIVTLLLSFYILGNSIPSHFLWGFLFLVCGTFLIARFRMNWVLVRRAFISGSVFACHYIALQVLFDLTHFDNAFFWSRIGISVVALVLLFDPVFRKNKDVSSGSVSQEEDKKGGGYVLVIINKILAGIASLLILKAISLGDIAIVQALTGLQFVFLILFSAFLGNKTSHHVGENVTNIDIVQKVVSVSIIVTGFTLLFV